MKLTSYYLGSVLLLGLRTKFFSNEILYFEGDINYTKIYFSAGQRKMIARTLLYVQQRVDTNDFVRVSRKHLVNRKFIVQINNDVVVLVDRTELPISRRKRSALA